MSSLRLVLVTRRFWPFAGSEETAMENLAVEFQRQGSSVQILTAQWYANWPTDVVHREVPVTRVRKPPQLAWGMLRYMMALSRWLRQHEREIDLVYVSHLQHDAHSVVGAMADSEIPVVLRAVGMGAAGDCRWQERARFGTRIRRRCQRADAFIASSRETVGELAAAGYAVNRTFQIPDGVDDFEPRDADRRWAAREALAAVNSDLATEGDAPVVVCVGRLVRTRGVFDLLRAWRSVVTVWPNARLWFIGDGSDREAIFDAVNDYGLRGNVMLPGTFDDMQGILQAADLCVLPSQEEAASSMAILEAMGASVPLVVTDIAGHRALVRNGEHALLVPPRDPRSLTSAIIECLNYPVIAAARAATARTLARQRHSLRRVAGDHLELFDRILAEKQND